MNEPMFYVAYDTSWTVTGGRLDGPVSFLATQAQMESLIDSHHIPMKPYTVEYAE